ncbi:Hydroxyacylglutathione hydrolase [Aquicella siphonis]|uniref:Hydroxyacylglutathione hydrolase n=1 Tax=Aquicella siphonis TaxID=254247 RepID=A0A5E4PEX9_9COXI|nr:hydroxyacylglutathione hydrolase [Aquicella siphonis]VVC74911.1 Hydroxyacylglutathione hydrolase [Aquicella siphonis]
MTVTKNIVIEPVRTLKDNYVWTLINHKQLTAVIVDPGEARPVIDFLNNRQLSLLAILVTHHHWDHTGGIAEILNHFDAPVYGPAEEKIPQITHRVSEGTQINITGFPVKLQTLEIPGHTSGHVAYYGGQMLFCGDTLFAAGCGRIFEGTPAQMYSSLQKLAALPDDTLVYCAHEYTLNNLRFAKTVEPGNLAIEKRMEKVEKLVNKNLPSLPALLNEEKETNPFLRCHLPEIKSAVERRQYQHLNDPVAVFAALRKWKDNFQ